MISAKTKSADTIMKTNPFVHVYEQDGRKLIFDASIPKFYAVSDEVAGIIESAKQSPVSFTQLGCTDGQLDTQIRRLSKYGILLDEHESICDSPVLGWEKKPQIDTIFFIVSDACNYLCEYCHIMHNKIDTANRNLTREQAVAYLSYFDKVSDHTSKRNVVFFGGEPLLNFDVIEESVKFCDGSDNLEFALFTNCSLVTDEIAQKLANWNVKVIASIDGFENEHGRARTFVDGSSSYNKTMNGYRLLQKHGCIVGISCTVGKHNVERLPETCAELIDTLSPVNIGFNILHDRIGQEKQTVEELRYVNSQMLGAYKVCMDKGVYFVQAVNRLRPIIDERPRAQDCGAYGRQIVVTPSDSIGPCEVFSSSGPSFAAFDPNIDVQTDEVFIKWANRFPIHFPECKGCHAIALCGGGCAYDSVLRYGDIEHKDVRCCEQAFVFFEFVKDFIFRELYEPVDDYGIKPVTREGLKRLYGNIDVNSEFYPLTTYHKRLNIHKEGQDR